MIFFRQHVQHFVIVVAIICVCGIGYQTISYLQTVPTAKVVQKKVSLPSNASLFDQGEYYFNHGQYADGTYDLVKAQSFFEQAIAVDQKDNELLWYQSGRIDFLNGNFDSALEKFQKQITYFGNAVPNVYYMIGLTYGYKARRTNDPMDWQKAEEGFTNAITFSPKAPWPYVDLSWLYFSQGKYEQMSPVLNQALYFNPDNPWILNMYGLGLLNSGHKIEAHEYFVLALASARLLTETDWGRSYPGNDPALWGTGLFEFQAILEKNISITQE